MRDTFLYRLACVAAVLAFIVVLLGAYTRLKDAGLGCPDWPGCYGHLTVPKINDHPDFSGQVVEPVKAWAEMSHRYVAGTLGLLVVVIFARCLWLKRKMAVPLGLSTCLLLWVVLQASLGRWTVTLKLLPPVVMFHLLGGFTLFALLVLLALRLKRFFSSVSRLDQRRFRWWALLGLLLIIGQISLGGWTSANYASLSCPHFPYCADSLVPELHFERAFTIIDKIGLNYQGGLLDQATRMTIHFFHRAGAVLVFGYWVAFLLYLLAKAESVVLLRFTLVIFCLLVSQLVLGVCNVVLMLPLAIAVAHNGMAALLLVTVVALNYAVWASKRETL